MKILIDIPKEFEDWISVHNINDFISDMLFDNSVEGKVLDNMTNKEIMCTLYPDQIYGVSELKHKDGNLCDVTFEVERTSEEWWNAKYKGEE